MAKKITKSANLAGDRGEAIVNEQLASFAIACHPTNKSVEAGIDGFYEIVDDRTEEATGSIFAGQTKATAGLLRQKQEKFTIYCKQQDIEYWHKFSIPVILFYVDLNTRNVYWLSARDDIRASADGGATAVKFDAKRDLLGQGTIARLRQRVSGHSMSTSIPAIPQVENLATNIFKVAYPSRLYVAPCEHTTNDAFKTALRNRYGQYDLDWLLSGGMVLSFHDLRSQPWAQMCDRGAVEEFDTEEWAKDEDPRRVHEFRLLLGRCLLEKVRRKNLRFDPSTHQHYFPATPKLGVREERYLAKKESARRAVFKGYPPDSPTYYRHAAFNSNFVAYDARWYCVISPGYVFTSDGESALKKDDHLRSGIKRLERNSAVRGQLYMWRQVLAAQGTMFDESYDYLSLGPMIELEATLGVDDEAWLAREDQEEAAISGAEDGMFSEDQQ